MTSGKAQVSDKSYKMKTEGQVLKTIYYGDVTTRTIQHVIDEWSGFKAEHPNLDIFVFDYTEAKMARVETEDAVKIASHPIFSSGLMEDIYIIGILKEKRDYAIACLWATWLFKSNTFPGENVFLYRTRGEAEQQIARLKQQNSPEMNS